MEKIKKTIYEQNGSINKEVKNIKGNQKKILELRSTVTTRKNPPKGFKHRFEQVEERISKL